MQGLLTRSPFKKLKTMPAKNLQRIDKEGLFLHIYNQGVEGRNLFNDEEDYNIFTSYLKNYLTPPPPPNSVKQSFQIKGHTFQGTPHQPKNYYNQVELLAYSLMPNHFHLLVHQLKKGSVENFIRSLCTRYSIYFNKKYARSGSLFAGPYRSTMIIGKDIADLTRFLHLKEAFSSYPEYVGTRESSWVKPQIVSESLAGQNYKHFLEKYQAGQLLESTLLEKESEHLEKRETTSNPEPLERREPTSNAATLNIFVGSSIIFFMILTALGLRNIWISEYDQFQTDKAAAEVLSAKSEVNPVPEITATPQPTPEATAEPTPQPTPIPTIIIKLADDGLAIVNIRQKPSVSSEKVGTAKTGDIFELISKDSDWFEVKLASSSGFISDKYAIEQPQLPEERDNLDE